MIWGMGETVQGRKNEYSPGRKDDFRLGRKATPTGFSPTTDVQGDYNTEYFFGQQSLAWVQRLLDIDWQAAEPQDSAFQGRSGISGQENSSQLSLSSRFKQELPPHLNKDLSHQVTGNSLPS